MKTCKRLVVGIPLLAFLLCLLTRADGYKTRGDLIALNKRSAMLLDRLMYNVAGKPLDDENEEGGGNALLDLVDGKRLNRRGNRYIRGKTYSKCFMNAVTCF